MVRPCITPLALGICLTLAACGGPASSPAEEAPPPGESAGAESAGAENAGAGSTAAVAPPPPTELCVAHAHGDEVLECALTAGRTTPSGVRVDVLHMTTTAEGQTSTGYHLVFRDADITQFADVVSGGDDGNGEWSSTCEVGELTGEGSHIGIEGRQRSFIRGCTGDPSCFDDDSNLELVAIAGARITCVPRAEVADDDFEPEYDDNDEEIPVLYVCERERFEPEGR